MDQKLRTGLAWRIREVREDLYGPHGARFLADALELPLKTWVKYERGVTIPAEVILRLVVATGVSPHWLLDGLNDSGIVCLSHRNMTYSIASASPPTWAAKSRPHPWSNCHLGDARGLPTGEPVAQLRHQVTGEVFQHPSIIDPAMVWGQAYTDRRVA